MSKELWKMQESFTEKFFATKGGMPDTEQKLTDATKDYLLHLMKEVTEVLDQISFKMHRTPKDFVDRDNLLEEMIDCQKYLWGLMHVWGFGYEEFADEFKRKSSVVEQRFAQERSMHELRDARCVLIDIDGVLSDYPRCYYQWVGDNCHIDSEYEVVAYLKTLSVVERERLKREYRQSGAKATLPVLQGAREMLKLIADCGIKVILLTNRPYAEHFRIYPDTLAWLRDNELHYDAIIWARDKGFEAVKNFRQVLWALDDTEENIKRLTDAGVDCVHIAGRDATLKFYEFLKTLNASDMQRAAQLWRVK